MRETARAAAQSARRAANVAQAAALVATLALTAAFIVAEHTAPAVDVVATLVTIAAMLIALLAAGVAGAAALRMPLPDSDAAAAKGALRKPLFVLVRAEVQACLAASLATMAAFGAGIPLAVQVGVAALLAFILAKLVEHRLLADGDLATRTPPNVREVVKAEWWAVLEAVAVPSVVAVYRTVADRAGLKNQAWLTIGLLTYATGRAAQAALKAAQVARRAAQTVGKDATNTPVRKGRAGRAIYAICARVTPAFAILCLFFIVLVHRLAEAPAVISFHESYNNGRFDAIWDGAHPARRNGFQSRDIEDAFKTKKDFQNYLQDARRTYGKAISTRHLNTNHVDLTSWTERLVVVQKTKFEKGTGTEYFVFEIIDHKPVLVGYDLQYDSDMSR